MMKLFKKLLAVAMVAVLALTVLTACADESNPDKVIPADDETYTIYSNLNQGAVEKGLGQLDYSVKYTKVAEDLLNNWLNNRTDVQKYEDGRKAIIDDLDDGVSIIISEKNVAAVNVTNNLSNVKYNSYYSVMNYDAADKVGIAFVDTKTQRYMLICTFKTKSF